MSVVGVLWISAVISSPALTHLEGRAAAMRYVAGIAFQILWLSRLALTDGDGGPWVFLFLVVFELSVSPIGGRVAEAVWRGVAGRAGVCGFMINLA